MQPCKTKFRIHIRYQLSSVTHAQNSSLLSLQPISPNVPGTIPTFPGEKSHPDCLANHPKQAFLNRVRESEFENHARVFENHEEAFVLPRRWGSAIRVEAFATRE